MVLALTGPITKVNKMRRWVYSFIVASLAGCQPTTPGEPNIWFFVLVKSSNYAQSESGEMGHATAVGWPGF